MNKRHLNILLLIPSMLFVNACNNSYLEQTIDTNIVSDITKEELIAAINNSYQIRSYCRSFSSISEEAYYPHKLSASDNMQYQTYKKNGLSVSKYADYPEIYTTAHFDYETEYKSLNGKEESYKKGYDKDELRFCEKDAIKIITTLIIDNEVTSRYGTIYKAFNQAFIDYNFELGSTVNTSDIFLGDVIYGLNSKKEIVVKQSYSEIVQFKVGELDEDVECGLYHSNLYLLVDNGDGYYIRNVEQRSRYCSKNNKGEYENTDEATFYSTFIKLGFYFGWLGYYDQSKIPEIKEEDYYIGMGLL